LSDWLIINWVQYVKAFLDTQAIQVKPTSTHSPSLLDKGLLQILIWYWSLYPTENLKTKEKRLAQKNWKAQSKKGGRTKIDSGL